MRDYPKPAARSAAGWQPVISRARLLTRLDESVGRRLTIILADAGYGKSVLLRSWAADHDCLWYSVDDRDGSLSAFALGMAAAFEGRFPLLSRDLRLVVQTSLGPDGDESDRVAPLATLICDALEDERAHDLVLVFDDAHLMGRRSPAVRLLQEICHQAPPSVHIIVATRSEPPFPIQRLRGRGEVLDIDAAMLTFTREETAQLITNALGDAGADLVDRVHEMTAGWPAAARLTVEALRGVPPDQRDAALQGLHRPGGRLFDYVAEEVFGRAAAPVKQLLRRVAYLDEFSPDLCKALGIRAAGNSIAALRRTGLFLETRGTAGGGFALHALLREFVRARWPLDSAELATVHTRAAAWYQANGRYDQAIESLLEIADLRAVANVLEAHGAALLSAGKLDSIIRTVRQLPAELRSDAIDRLAGEAFEIRGEWDEALRCFEHATREPGGLDAGLAWRLGLIQHLRGRLDQALEIYQRGQLDGADSSDAALLLAWRAAAHWLQGDERACRTAADQSLHHATIAGDPKALAAAHTVLAMLAALTGDRLRNDAHYVQALDYAERAGDVLQAVRIRTNRGSQHLEEGEYEQALTELDLAIRLADLTGFTFFRALALANRGEARASLGFLEEATADLELSKRLYQRAGSRMVCYPLGRLGDVYRRRGDLAMAQACYQEARRYAEESGDVQGLVPALAGLARLLAGDDVEQARKLADRAVSFGAGMAHVGALLAQGWVALAAGSANEAAVSADRAAAEARLRRDRAGLAEALELVALASSDRSTQLARLHEAIALWQGIHDPLRTRVAELILVSIREGSGSAGQDAAERRLLAAGAYSYRQLLAVVRARSATAEPGHIEITSLGGFWVMRRGQRVGRQQWQSRKARDLLKILLTRRGRPVPRSVLMDLLWPEQDPQIVGNRLSVALSTLRGVLDPGRQRSPDHFVTSDSGAIGLRLAHLRVDVEEFLTAAEAALDSWREGATPEAQARLEAAEAKYTGDFLEEDLYEDWAAPLREQCRTTYVSVATALAALADSAEDHAGAIRYRLRVLERDPYDETAHLGIVKALDLTDRHGEARRAYRNYVTRLNEIGVEPAPFPSKPHLSA